MSHSSSPSVRWQTLLNQQKWAEIFDATQQEVAGSFVSHQIQVFRYIGNAARQAQQTDLALRCFLYQKQLEERTGQPSAESCGWISELYAEEKDYASAKSYGELTIALNQKSSEQHRPKRQVVAFSLFGDKPEYCEMAVLNAEAMPQVYPDWTMVLYHDQTVPIHVLNRLSALNVELISAKEAQVQHWPGTFWRFLALEDLRNDIVLMRDADSMIGARERVLVNEWLCSDKPFHTIRDWYGQTDLVLAGLWGARSGLLSGIRRMVEDYLKTTPKLHPTHADQRFLQQYVWPRIEPYTLCHSSVFDVPNAVWAEGLPRVHEVNGEAQQLGFWHVSRYQLEAPKSDYLVNISEQGTTICSYIVRNDNAFELPVVYKQRILAGHYQLNIFQIATQGSSGG